MSEKCEFGKLSRAGEGDKSMIEIWQTKEKKKKRSKETALRRVNVSIAVIAHYCYIRLFLALGGLYSTATPY